MQVYVGPNLLDLVDHFVMGTFLRLNTIPIKCLLSFFLVLLFLEYFSRFPGYGTLNDLILKDFQYCF